MDFPPSPQHSQTDRENLIRFLEHGWVLSHGRRGMFNLPAYWYVTDGSTYFPVPDFAALDMVNSGVVQYAPEASGIEYNIYVSPLTITPPISAAHRPGWPSRCAPCKRRAAPTGRWSSSPVCPAR